MDDRKFYAWARRTIGMTQKELAANAGVSPASVRKIEKHERNLTPRMKRRFTEALGLHDAERMACLRSAYDKLNEDQRA